MKKPIIIITIDSHKGSENGYSKRDWYCLREDYAKAVADLGGIPLMLAQTDSCIDDYIAIADGIIFSGGDFDIDPKFYGEKKTASDAIYNQQRGEFEHKLIKKAIDTNIPLLGICAGEQLINVACGGTLIQSIKNEIKNPLKHAANKYEQDYATHSVKIQTETILFTIIKKKEITVNSSHRQAINKVGKDIIITATSSDGVIEAIEHKKKKFCIGIQWHPEIRNTEYDSKILQSFIENTKLYQHKKINIIS